MIVKTKVVAQLILFLYFFRPSEGGTLNGESVW